MSSEIQKLINEVQDYKETLLTIIAFGHELRWDSNKRQIKDESYFLPGRRMITSSKNKISKEAEITPDILVQINDSYGVVAEVKKSFADNYVGWENMLNQLLKYDDNLEGWVTNTQKISKSDLTLLTHNSRKVAIRDFIEKKKFHQEKLILIIIFQLLHLFW